MDTWYLEYGIDGRTVDVRRFEDLYVAGVWEGGVKIVLGQFRVLPAREICEQLLRLWERTRIRANLARPFTETDWYGFAGAECFPDESRPANPVMREVNGYLLVADANGVECYHEGGATTDCYRLDAQLNQAGAMAFLNGLPADFQPAQFGFQS